MVCLNLVNLLDDSWVVFREATNPAKRSGSLVNLACADQVSRCFRQNNHSEEKNQRPGKLNRNRDAVASRVVAILGGIVHNGSKEQADGDTQLVRANDGTANEFRSRFGLV